MTWLWICSGVFEISLWSSACSQRNISCWITQIRRQEFLWHGAFFVNVDCKDVNTPMVPQVSGQISPRLPLAAQSMGEGGFSWLTGACLLREQWGRAAFASFSPPDPLHIWACNETHDTNPGTLWEADMQQWRENYTQKRGNHEQSAEYLAP